MNETYIAHHGILGMKWGVRRYQNPDGTLTAEGRKRYDSESTYEINKAWDRSAKKYGTVTIGKSKRVRQQDIQQELIEKWLKEDHTFHDTEYHKKKSGSILSSVLDDFDDSLYDIGDSYAESFLDYKLSDVWN